MAQQRGRSGTPIHPSRGRGGRRLITAMMLVAPGRRRRLAVALITGAAALAVPSTALATVIGFESPPVADGTELSSQYAAQGVTFTTGAPTQATTLPVTASSGSAHSGSHVASISRQPDEFPVPTLGGAFSLTRGTVSIYVRDVTHGSFTAHLTLEGLNDSGTVVAASNSDTQTSITSVGSPWVQLSMSSGSEDIASFRIVSHNDGGQLVEVDDLSYDDPVSPASGEIQLGAPTVTAVMSRGSALTRQIAIQRINNSNGDVTLSATGLPAGVSAGFSPNPVAGTGSSATMTLTASDGAAISTNAPLTVTGTPAAGAGSHVSVVQLSLSVDAGFTVSSPLQAGTAPSPGLTLAPCSTAGVAVALDRGPSFTRDVTLSATDPGGAPLPAGLAAGFSPPTLSGAATSSTLTVQRADNGPQDPSAIRVTATSGGLSQTFEIPLAQPGPSISAVSTVPTGGLSAFTPQGLGAGTTVVLAGAGICPGATAQWGDPDPMAAPGTDPDRGQAVATLNHPRDGVWNLVLPPLAVSGPVKVINPSGTAATSTQALSVSNFRHTNGFQFANRAWNAGSIADWHALFGASIDFNLNPCSPVDCSIDTHLVRPEVVLLIAAFNAALRGSGGTCVGFSIASRRLATGQVALSRFAHGASTVWQLSDSEALFDYLQVQHENQFSAEFLNAYWTQRTGGLLGTRGAAGFRGDLERELRLGRRPVVVMSQGGAGHAVVAYDVTSAADGGYDIRVYDDNVPFTTGEDTSYTAHRSDADSVIHVGPGGVWTFHPLGYTGGMADITEVTAEHDIPVQPTFVDSLDGLRIALIGAGSAGAAAKRSAASGASAVQPFPSFDPGSTPTPEFLVDAKRTGELPVIADAHGHQEITFGGAGGAGQISAEVADRARAEVTLPAGQTGASYTTTHPAKLTLTLFADGPAGATRGAVVQTSATRAEDVRFDRSRQRLTVAHTGAAQIIRFTLTETGSPATFVSGPLRLPAGESLTVRANWQDLAAGATAVFTGRSGMHSMHLADRARIALKPLMISARRRGATVRVRVGLGVAGAPRLVHVAIAIVSGRHRLAEVTKTLRTAARTNRTIALRLGGKTPRGRLRAVVTALLPGGTPTDPPAQRTRSVFLTG